MFIKAHFEEFNGSSSNFGQNEYSANTIEEITIQPGRHIGWVDCSEDLVRYIAAQCAEDGFSGKIFIAEKTDGEKPSSVSDLSWLIEDESKFHKYISPGCREEFTISMGGEVVGRLIFRHIMPGGITLSQN